MAGQEGTKQPRQPVTIDQAEALSEAEAHAQGVPPLPPGFNPRYWVFNPKTINFHRVLGRQAGYYLIDPTLYDERQRDYLIARSSITPNRRILIIFFALFAIALWVMSWVSAENVSSVKYLLVWPLGFVAFATLAGVLFSEKVDLPRHLQKVGPPPPPSPGRQEVEKQKVHGQGGILGGDRLRQAARGTSTSNGPSAPLETFND